MINRLLIFVKEVFYRNRFIEDYKSSTSFYSKINIQFLAALGFFILSIANILSRSYIMLIFTASGCVINIAFAVVAKKLKKGFLCSFSTIMTCSVLFGLFTIYGGNDGFASLWVVLMPLLSMVSMNFIVGLLTSVFFQIFLIIIFWTPVREMLFYTYNDQFCLRFPLFFFVTFVIGLMLTISMQKSEYNEYKQLLELEKVTAEAQLLARTDPLTKLANRRFAYEEFEAKYTTEGYSHCIVMGDIDSFKNVNDTYGHEFGDKALLIFTGYINELLPQDYLKSRWGGEEFLFAANESIDEVYVRIENLRKKIAEHEFNYNGISVHITITFGIAEYKNKEELSKAISKADDRLYRGKMSTKNCTVITD